MLRSSSFRSALRPKYMRPAPAPQPGPESESEPELEEGEEEEEETETAEARPALPVVQDDPAPAGGTRTATDEWLDQQTPPSVQLGLWRLFLHLAAAYHETSKNTAPRPERKRAR